MVEGNTHAEIKDEGKDEFEGLTVYQIMQKRLGTGDPAKGLLAVLDRVERLEKAPKKMGRPKGSKNKE